MNARNQRALSALAEQRRARPQSAESATLTLRRILVPQDFSGKSRKALKVAVPLAEQYGGKIFLLHVVEPVYPAAPFPREMRIAAVDPRPIANACRKRLSELARELVPPELLGGTRVRSGRAYLGIVDAADELKADLIALSTHGYKGLRHAFLGSTTEHVVRHAHCPVATVRRRPDAAPEDRRKAAGGCLPWRRILVPLDFSLTSLRALDAGARLAQDSGARLFLLHVVEPTPYAAGMNGVALAIPDSVLVERAKAALPRVARRFVHSLSEARHRWQREGSLMSAKPKHAMKTKTTKRQIAEPPARRRSWWTALPVTETR